ncbi:Scr1 family TA system antitoxin-like transcriptional regulator [Streptomyces kanasensis]|uniref:Scr1 family TA system antitoxin-like transcriptional regulator n=1 Tax=Streptomyces kanasensis TaxID=936756 RepID=UPI003823B0A4
MASEAVHYTASRIPPGYRTAEYRDVIAACTPVHDEPLTGPPPWPAHVRRATGQRRTLLLDEQLLCRPVGAAAVMARQLRHLLRPMDDPTGPVTIRVVAGDARLAVLPPHRGGRRTHRRGPRLVCGLDLMLWYETRSGYAQTLHAALHRAVEQAHTSGPWRATAPSVSRTSSTSTPACHSWFGPSNASPAGYRCAPRCRCSPSTWRQRVCRGHTPRSSVTGRHSASRSTTSRQARCACCGW